MSYPNYDHHRAFVDIRAEHARQDAKWGVQKRADGTGGPVMRSEAESMRDRCEFLAANGGADWRAVLLEEIYEALAEDDPVKLRAELVQSAAVIVCWIEDIDSRTPPARPLSLSEAIIALVPGAEGAGIKP